MEKLLKGVRQNKKARHVPCLTSAAWRAFFPQNVGNGMGQEPPCPIPSRFLNRENRAYKAVD